MHMLSLPQIPLRMSSCVGKWYFSAIVQDLGEKPEIQKAGFSDTFFATVQGFLPPYVGL
jgi:hypothetical protein